MEALIVVMSVGVGLFAIVFALFALCALLGYFLRICTLILTDSRDVDVLLVDLKDEIVHLFTRSERSLQTDVRV